VVVNFLEVTLPTASQIPAIVALDRQCLSEPWSADGYTRELDSPNSHILIVRPIEESAATPDLIGLACLWAIVEEAHITRLAIHPNFQRRGLGQGLLLMLLTIAQQRGLEWATLEVKASNHGAIALYERMGFQSVGRRRHYYPDQEDALILWLNGLQTPAFEQWQHHQWSVLGDRLQQQGYQLFLPEEILKIITFPLDAIAICRKNHLVN
jgi:ribosomal-protein-alanine N-acetyltransferase